MCLPAALDRSYRAHVRLPAGRRHPEAGRVDLILKLLKNPGRQGWPAWKTWIVSASAGSCCARKTRQTRRLIPPPTFLRRWSSPAWTSISRFHRRWWPGFWGDISRKKTGWPISRRSRIRRAGGASAPLGLGAAGRVPPFAGLFRSGRRTPAPGSAGCGGRVPPARCWKCSWGRRPGPKTLTPAMLRLGPHSRRLPAGGGHLQSGAGKPCWTPTGLSPACCWKNCPTLAACSSWAARRLAAVRTGQPPVFPGGFSPTQWPGAFPAWQQALGRRAEFPLDVVRLVAGQYILTSGQIRNAVVQT